MPSPDVTYTLRTVFYVEESKYGTEAYLYDYFSLRIKDDCTDFLWSATASSGPSTFTYNVYPTAVETTLTVSLPTVGSTTCDDDPTVTWFYKEVGGSTWVSLTDSHPHVTSTTDTTIVFDGNAWDWGDQADGIVR